MTYGIGLVFDPHAEAHIREVWGRLASQGYTTPLARPGGLPHVSLILSETLQIDDLARDLEGLRHAPRRLEVRVSHLGMFTEPELVLFYGITPTAGLLRLHADVARMYRRWSTTITARTQPGAWVPHCTLATRVVAHRMSDAIATAATLPLPRVVHRVRLAMVQFDQAQVELLRLFPWQGSPVHHRRFPLRQGSDGRSDLTGA